MDAKKNGSTNWNPAGADGAASGTYNDVVLTLLMRANGNGKDENYSAFNLGWAKHWYGWRNKWIYFGYPGGNDQRIDFDIGGLPNILIFKHSVTDNIRQAWMNGTSKGAKTASISAPTIGGSFKFPGGNSSGTNYYDLTLGEILVVKGTMSDEVREKMEGYLAHKWGIGLPSSHTWAQGSPYEDFRNGAELTLYWGTSDGGETENWDQSISLG